MGSLAFFVVKAGGFLPGEPEKVTRTAFSKEKAGRVRAAGNVPREEHPTSRELKRLFLVGEPECRPLKRQGSSKLN